MCPRASILVHGAPFPFFSPRNGFFANTWVLERIIHVPSNNAYSNAVLYVIYCEHFNYAVDLTKAACCAFSRANPKAQIEVPQNERLPNPALGSRNSEICAVCFRHQHSATRA
jgi:hypothetical protein